MSEEEINLEKVKRLSQFPLLTMLSEGYIQSLAQSMMIKQYLPGELIILKGTIGTEFYFIDRGSVDVIADTQPCTPGLKDSVSLSLASDACNKSSSPMPLGESTR